MPAVLVDEFSIWRPGYQGQIVTVYVAGTTELAQLFTNEGLTIAAENPQTLLNGTVTGIPAGKFSVPIYTNTAYTLDIANAEQTGVTRVPLYALDGEDASEALVTAGTEARALEDHLSQIVWAEDYGTLDDADSATNTATLAAAIGVAGGLGGGAVRIPPGTFPFTTLSLPENVVLVGAGRDVTILQSQEQEAVITLSAAGAGLDALTLDGVDLQAGSIGVYGVGMNRSFFRDVIVKRFDTGIHFKGHEHAEWQNLYIDDCNYGMKAHGDTDSGDTSNGDAFEHNSWHGGHVSNCNTVGLDLSYEDEEVAHNSFYDVHFSGNEKAIRINGARWTLIRLGDWATNTTNIEVLDDDTEEAERRVTGLRLDGGRMQGGAATFTGLCQDVILQHMQINDVDFTLTLPDNNILVRDCVEDSLVTLGGTTTAYMRDFSTWKGAVKGVTTGSAATKAWGITLEPGEVVGLRAIVLANQRNGVDQAGYHLTALATRAGATLAYDNQTANFTVGQTLTGAISGATGLIIADSDSGTTGTLTLRNIEGTFQNNETITDGAGGSALANGTLSSPSCTVENSATHASFEDEGGFAVAFVASSSDVELRVTGETGHTMDWTAFVEVLRGG